MPLYLLTEARLQSSAEHAIDLVVVHGLDGHYSKTWVHTESGVLWLRDVLPTLLPFVRVLSFGYDASSVSRKGGGAASIQQLAETLVADLCSNRDLDGCRDRPIIFVCHGLGGIIVKKALTYSSTRTGLRVEHNHDIYLATFAIMFFGVPHLGLDEQIWLKSLDKTGLHIPGKTTSASNLLSALRVDSEILRAVDADFTSLIKQFRVFLLWEGLMTTSGGQTHYLVSQPSAAPGMMHAERAGINATHDNMVRFSSERDPNIALVIEALGRYCKEAPLIIESRQLRARKALTEQRQQEAAELVPMRTVFDLARDDEATHQAVIDPTQRNRYFKTPQAVTSLFTGRQHLSTSLYDKFFPQGKHKRPAMQCRFVIFGMPGSGKTQFCCKFAQDFREKFFAVCTVDASSIDTARQSYEDIGRMGGLERTEKAGKHWLTNLQEPWLLILDNADDSDLDLATMFPEGERGHILITTRNEALCFHQTIGTSHFTGLTEYEATHLLLLTAQEPRPWQKMVIDDAKEITKRLGCLALAIVQAGVHILSKFCTFKTYLQYHEDLRTTLHGRRANLKRRSSSGDANTSVYTSFSMCVEIVERRNPHVIRDVEHLLNVVAFYHFDRIPLEIFTRSIRNRNMQENESKHASIPSRILQSVQRHLEYPDLLPGFLKHGHDPIDVHRIRSALKELTSLSLVSYNPHEQSFSLHPVVHEWARDRLQKREQQVWHTIAVNTLLEAVLLPPADLDESGRSFRAAINPHLRICLNNFECAIDFPRFKTTYGGWRLPLAVTLNWGALACFRTQVLRAAKVAFVYLERGQFNDAAAIWLKVVQALQESQGLESEKTTAAMTALAHTYWGLGRLTEAIELQKMVWDSKIRMHGAQARQTLVAMDALGESYWLNSQYDEALSLQVDAVERMRHALGRRDPDTLKAMDNLGVTFGSWRRFQESAEIHRQVLEARLQVGKGDDLDTLKTKQNLAMAMLDLKELDKAQVMINYVYEQRRIQLGKEHPWTLWALCYLAKVKRESGFLEEAEALLIPGIEAAKRSLGDDHLGVLMGSGELAIIWHRQGKSGDAESLTLSIIRQLESARGEEHYDTVLAYRKLAILYEHRFDLEKAVEALETARVRVGLRLTNKHPLGKEIEDDLRRLRLSIEEVRTNKAQDSQNLHSSEQPTLDSIRPRQPRKSSTY